MLSSERPAPIRVERKTPSPRARFQDPWVPYPEGVAVVKELKSLLARPNEGRPVNLALMAAPSHGKSHLLDFFADAYPDITDPGPPRIQVLNIELPPAADAAKLLREILRTLSVDFSVRHPPDELLRKVVIHVQSMLVGLIIIDEFHNALGGRRDRTMEVVQYIRALSNRTQRPIVVAGTSKVGEVLRYDEQLNERFTKWTLPLWNDLAYVVKLLATFELTLGPESVGTLANTEIGRKVIEISKGRPGSFSQLLREGRQMALRTNGGVITKEILEACEHRLVGRTNPQVVA